MLMSKGGRPAGASAIAAFTHLKNALASQSRPTNPKKSGPKNGTARRSRFWDRKVPMKRLAKDSGQRSKKWDRLAVPFLGPHLLRNVEKKKK